MEYIDVSKREIYNAKRIREIEKIINDLKVDILFFEAEIRRIRGDSKELDNCEAEKLLNNQQEKQK